jgi:hypothetical protein
MNSTLLGLPREIKELIYFDALSHTAEKILVGSYVPSLLSATDCTRPFLFRVM